MCTISCFAMLASATFGRIRSLLVYLGGCKCYMRMCTSNVDDFFVPPEAVRGCTKLDRSAFLKEFELPCIKIARPSLCSSFLKRLSHARLRCSFIKHIINITSVADGKVSFHFVLSCPSSFSSLPSLTLLLTPLPLACN